MSFINVTRDDGHTPDQATINGNPTAHTAYGVNFDRPSPRRTDWRVLLAIVLFVGLTTIYLIVRFTQYLARISQETSWLDVWIVAALKASPLLFIAIGAYWLFGDARRRHIERLPNNMPVHIRDITAADWSHAALGSLTAFYDNQNEWARHSTYASLNQLDVSNEGTPQAPAPELPAPSGDEGAPVEAVPISTWLQWVNEQPHALISAKTKGGKSTTTKAILASRITAGEKIIVIDPHDSEWLGLPSFGGGENWNEVRAAMDCVSDEYQRRLDVRKEYKQRTGKELQPHSFQRLTCVLDEANITRLSLDKGKRGEVTPWERFATILGSGARKVNISILLLCQSANVEDLGLTKPMRENFFRLALDENTCDYLIKSEEYDQARRKELRAALQGRMFPAMCEYRSTVYLLDRTGLDQIDTPTNTKVAVWDGCDNIMLSSLLGATTDDNCDDTMATSDDHDDDEVVASESEVISMSSVIITPEEATKIATLLQSSSASQVAKSLDGYNGRNYQECKAKVSKVQQMIGLGE